MLDSVEVYDAALKRELPGGPCWRRYPFGAYGQKADGSAYDGTGEGCCWPILTGERGHYELAAGRDPLPFIQAMERKAEKTSARKSFSAGFDHGAGARQLVASFPGLRLEDLPGQEGRAVELVRMSSHAGTHRRLCFTGADYCVDGAAGEDNRSDGEAAEGHDRKGHPTDFGLHPRGR